MKLDRIIAVKNSKTIYRNGDKCIKVFYTGYTKSDVLNEALNQARIEETGLNIPKILEVTMVDGKWAIVSEFIKGKNLAQLMQEDPANKEKYLELFVKLQMDIHTKTCPLLSKLKDKMSLKISISDLDATSRFDLLTRLDGIPTPNKVCHGDFNPTNIIMVDGKEPYILDWSHATQGNGSADAALTYLLFCLNGDKETAKEYINMFCEKSNTNKEFIKIWLPLVAISQSVKCNDQDREYLLNFVNNAEYESIF